MRLPIQSRPACCWFAPTLLMAISLACGVSPMARGAGPTTQSDPCPMQAAGKLDAGKTPHTFHFIYSHRIVFSMHDSFPVAIEIVPATLQPATVATSMSDRNPIGIEADLPPGSYTLQITPDVAGARRHNPSYREQEIFIDNAGMLSYPFGLRNIEFIGRIDGMFPNSTQFVKEKRPLFKWAAVPGAKLYHIEWDVRGNPKSADVKQPQFQLDTDLAVKDGWRCLWSVTAYNDRNQVLAQGDSAFWIDPPPTTIPAPPETDLAVPPQPPPALAPTPDSGFMGVGAREGTIPTGGRRVIEHDGAVVYHWDGDATFIPAMQIFAVLPGSPALAAGLRPGDQILRVDGKPIPINDGKPSTRAFIRMICDLPPGKKVKIIYRRGWGDEQDQAADVVIGRRPELK